MSEAVRVEVLRHEGCPLAAAARDLVRDCARELDVDVVVVGRVVRHPSPTVLIDGLDVMGGPGVGASVDACRLDVPTRERVIEALLRLVSAGRLAAPVSAPMDSGWAGP